MIKTIRNPFGPRLRTQRKPQRIRLPILQARRKQMKLNKKSQKLTVMEVSKMRQWCLQLMLLKYIITKIVLNIVPFTDSLLDPIGLVSDSNSHTEKEENSNTSSPKKENNTGFSNSPSLASISSLSSYYILSSLLNIFINYKPLLSCIFKMSHWFQQLKALADFSLA